MKAVIYVRDTKNCLGAEDQRNICRKYAAENGYTILREYADCLPNDIDGNHNAFNEMFRDSRKRKFHKILVYNAECFCQFVTDLAIYKIRLAEYGVEVITVTESAIDETCDMLIERFPQFFAEYKKMAHSESVKRGIRLAKERRAALAAQATAGDKPAA